MGWDGKDNVNICRFLIVKLRKSKKVGDFALKTAFTLLLMSIVIGQVNESYSSVGTHPTFNASTCLRFGDLCRTIF